MLSKLFIILPDGKKLSLEIDTTIKVRSLIEYLINNNILSSKDLSYHLVSKSNRIIDNEMILGKLDSHDENIFNIISKKYSYESYSEEENIKSQIIFLNSDKKSDEINLKPIIHDEDKVAKNFTIQNTGIPVFISYSHEDDFYREELETHLKILQRQKLIESWSDRRIAPGSNWEEEINLNIKNSRIIILLVSSNFLASDYCYETETIFALEQHEKKKAIVIPIIIRPCLWKRSKFNNLQVLPKNGEAISTWNNKDSAWLSILEEIIKVIEKLPLEINNIIVEGNGNVTKIGSEIYVIDNKIDNATFVEIVENNLSFEDEVIRFLQNYNEWYFSPLRINKWGEKRIDFGLVLCVLKVLNLSPHSL